MSSSGPNKDKTDDAWPYCTRTEKTGTLKCNFCNEHIGGGIYRMKFHLARMVGNNVRPCPKVDQDVQRQMVAIIESKASEKQTKKRTIAEIAKGFPPPPPQPSGFPESTHFFEEGGASGGATAEQTPTSRLRNPAGSSSAMRCDFFASRGGQTTLDESWNKDKFKEARKAIANFWYYSNLSFNVANSPYWAYMVRAIAACGIGFKAPTYTDLRGSMLDEAVSDCQRVIDEQKKIWRRKGCSILSDGWTDTRGRTLLNFLAASSGGLVFLKSVDASGEIKNSDYLFGQLQMVIDEVGAENVVQVITDNASAYVKAGERIEKEYPTIFWTPCAAHVIDLLLEDIGKIEWIKEIVEKAKNITKYIYNHAWVLHLMRTDFTNGKGLIRPAATRFATSFLTLQSIFNTRLALKQMFVCNKWMESRYAREPDGKNVVNCIFDDDYWVQALQILKITKPLVRVLRFVDSEKPSMGYVYEAMDKAKEAISNFFVSDASRFQYIWDMVDRRWNTQLHKPLHGAGIYLNPKFFYGDNFDPLNGEINSGLHKAINRLVPDKEIRTKIFRVELQDYKKAQGYLFSSLECIESRASLAPDLWWEDYGGNTPNLQKVAIKILSQPASSSGCERNWSTFEHIHSKKRNRLTHERLNDLVFVHYNLRLRHRNIEGTSNEAIELDEIEASDVWASWLKDVPNEPQDFDFTFEEYQRMEEQAIAMGEEAERVATEAEGAQGDTLAAGPSHRGADLEDDIDDDEPLIATRSRVAKERSRKAKHG